MDRGAWWATVHRVPKELDTEQTVLKNLYMSQELPLNPEVRKVIYYLYLISILQKVLKIIKLAQNGKLITK